MPFVTLLGASNSTPPAGGAATSDVIYATAGAMVVTSSCSARSCSTSRAASRCSAGWPTLDERVTEPPRLGGAARHLPRRHPADRGLRHVLGHLPAHRPGPRPGAARQPGPLLHPRRALRRASRRACSASPCPKGRPGPRSRSRPAGTRRSAPLMIAICGASSLAGLPARRHLAPDLRPGRHPLGPDPPDADRRRLALGARRLGAARRGRRGAQGGPRRTPLPAWTRFREIDPRRRLPGRASPPSRPSSTSVSRSSRSSCSRR